MTKKHMRGADGMYHINGKTFRFLVGKRAQVWHGTAYKTKGDLTKEAFIFNKNGRIVSKKKHATAKREKRLEKAGYFTQKGKFGFVRRDGSKSRKAKRGRR